MGGGSCCRESRGTLFSSGRALSMCRPHKAYRAKKKPMRLDELAGKRTSRRREWHNGCIKSGMATQVCESLFDSTLPERPGPVYLALWPTEDVPNPQSAMDLLRAKVPKPIPLVPVQWGANLTVIVEAYGHPRIWFGRRVPTGDWESDLAQIIRVLGENGIDAELSLDIEQLAPRGIPNTDL